MERREAGAGEGAGPLGRVEKRGPVPAGAGALARAESAASGREQAGGAGCAPGVSSTRSAGGRDAVDTAATAGSAQLRPAQDGFWPLRGAFQVVGIGLEGRLAEHYVAIQDHYLEKGLWAALGEDEGGGQPPQPPPQQLQKRGKARGRGRGSSRGRRGAGQGAGGTGGGPEAQLRGEGEGRPPVASLLELVDVPDVRRAGKAAMADACGRAVAECLARHMGITPTEPRDIAQQLQSLPPDVPAHPGIVEFVVPQSDPRAGLRGELGARTKTVAEGGGWIVKHSFLGFYKGTMRYHGDYVTLMEQLPARSMHRDKLGLDSKGADLEVIHEAVRYQWGQACKLDLENDSTLTISALEGGNVLSRLNDPFIFAQGITAQAARGYQTKGPDVLGGGANCNLLNITIGPWVFPGMFAMRDIAPGEELTYSYEQRFWLDFVINKRAAEVEAQGEQERRGMERELMECKARLGWLGQSKPRPGGCSGEPTLPLSTHGLGAWMQHERQPASELDQQAQQAPLGRGGEGVPGGLAGRGAGHVAVADGAANGTRAPATSLQPAGAQQQLGAGSRPSGPPTSPTGPGGAGVARSSGAKRSRRRPTRGGIFTPQGRGSSGWQQQLGAASPRSVSPRQLSFAASGSLPAGAPPGGIGGSDAGRASQGEPFGGSAGEQAAKGPPREAQADEPGPATGQVSGRSQGCVVGAGAVEQAQPAGGEQQQRHAQPPPASAAAEVAAAEEALRQAKEALLACTQLGWEQESWQVVGGGLQGLLFSAQDVLRLHTEGQLCDGTPLLLAPDGEPLLVQDLVPMLQRAQHGLQEAQQRLEQVQRGLEGAKARVEQAQPAAGAQQAAQGVAPRTERADVAAGGAGPLSSPTPKLASVGAGGQPQAGGLGQQPAAAKASAGVSLAGPAAPELLPPAAELPSGGPTLGPRAGAHTQQQQQQPTAQGKKPGGAQRGKGAGTDAPPPLSPRKRRRGVDPSQPTIERWLSPTKAPAAVGPQQHAAAMPAAEQHIGVAAAAVPPSNPQHAQQAGAGAGAGSSLASPVPALSPLGAPLENGAWFAYGEGAGEAFKTALWHVLEVVEQGRAATRLAALGSDNRKRTFTLRRGKQRPIPADVQQEGEWALRRSSTAVPAAAAAPPAGGEDEAVQAPALAFERRAAGQEQLGRVVEDAGAEEAGAKQQQQQPLAAAAAPQPPELPRREGRSPTGSSEPSKPGGSGSAPGPSTRGSPPESARHAAARVGGLAQARGGRTSSKRKARVERHCVQAPPVASRRSAAKERAPQQVAAAAPSGGPAAKRLRSGPAAAAAAAGPAAAQQANQPAHLPGKPAPGPGPQITGSSAGQAAEVVDLTLDSDAE